MPTKRKTKKHACEECGARLATGTSYDRHMAKKHGVMSFRGRGKSRHSCGHCSHISLTQAEHNRHRKRAHGLAPIKRVRKDRRSSEQKAHDAARSQEHLRVAFFYKNAGVVGKKREYAKELAHAEAEAARRGWRVEWEYDDLPYEMGDAETEHPSEVLVAVLKDEEGKVLSSLGGIGDPSHSYKRVVEAELALEALD